jgi:predicted nucleic acid-binding protein
VSAVVFDASVLVKLVAEEPGTQTAARAYKAAGTVLAPAWARVECAQALWKKVRRGEWSPHDARKALCALDQMALQIADASALVPQALDLACALNHSVYDCLYIALAITEDVPLVTADIAQGAAAEAGGVKVVWLDS